MEGSRKKGWKSVSEDIFLKNLLCLEVNGSRISENQPRSGGSRKGLWW